MTTETIETDDSLPLREMQRIVGGACTGCSIRLSGRDGVFSIALGLKDAPRCLNCAASGLDRDPDDLCRQLVAYVLRRECFRKAWSAAQRLDGVAFNGAIGDEEPELMNQYSGHAAADETWDAGDMGCGELVMALRIRLKSMSPGGVIEVTARDAAAPEDLPAWCRLCGHTLLAANHPTYVIRRKED